MTYAEAIKRLRNKMYTSKNNTIPKINEETHKIPSFFCIYPPNNARRDWAITIFFLLFH